MKFHHLAIATKNIYASIEFYLSLGYESSDVIFDPIQNVSICFLNKKNEPRIELIAAVDENSPVTRILKKNGSGVYHTCYVVGDIDLAIANLKKQHFILLSKPVKAVALKNKLVCFLFNNDVGLIELLEE